jgi:hypothetical protein
MSRDDRTKAVLELLDELEGLDAGRKNRRLLEISLEDHFAIKDHDETLEKIQSDMAGFPCQNNSFLTFFSSLSRGKQLMTWLSGAVFAFLVLGGAILGFLAWWKQH